MIGTNHYRLFLTLLKNYLDENTIDTIRQTNRIGREFADDLKPISINVEGTMLLSNKDAILEIADKADGSNFTKVHFERLNKLFKHLEILKNGKKDVPIALIAEINTLTALCQLKQFDDIRLFNLTRLTDTFCQTLVAKTAESSLFLRKLTISSLSLTHLSHKIGQLKQLEEITIEFAKLQKLPNEIGELINLRKLNILMSQINTLPASLCELAKLEELNVNSCQLTLLPADIGRSKLLQVLDVSTNNLTALPDSLTECAGLRKLSFHHNPQISSLPTLHAKMICMDLEVFATYIAEHEGQLPLDVSNNKNLLFLRGNFPDFTINRDFLAADAPLQMQLADDYPEDGYVMTNAEGDADNLPEDVQRLVFIHDDRLINDITSRLSKVKLK